MKVLKIIHEEGLRVLRILGLKGLKFPENEIKIRGQMLNLLLIFCASI
jgi:hypothetical protein